MEKNLVVRCKDDVHRIYSTSFGLHVAVLTNEGNGKRKFVFTQRSRAKGQSLYYSLKFLHKGFPLLCRQGCCKTFVSLSTKNC